jgi:serine/threonine protein kinase
MELCSCSLRDFLRKRNYSGIIGDMEFEKKCISGIIRGLSYIHQNGILHRDLNPNNIFLDKSMTLKIGDFGMAIKNDMSHNTSSCSSLFGVELFMPPEFKNKNIYVEKSDVYSAGIVFFEILHIFTTDMERIKIITELRQDKYPNTFTLNFPNYYKLVQKMLKIDVKDRISSREIEEQYIKN